MKKTSFAALILALFLSACGPSYTVLSPADLVAPTDDAYVTTSCIRIYKDSAPADARRQGIVLLNSYKDSSHFFFLNLATGQQTDLTRGDETIADTFVSPDRKTVAFKSGNPKTNEWSVVVSDAQGQRTASMVWPQGFFVLESWLNNQQTLILTYPPMVVFNPFTQEKRSFEITDFQNFDNDPTSNRYAIFDAKLERAVYKNVNGSISLYDLANKKILAEVPNQYAAFAVAAWAPDSSQVAVVGVAASGTKSSNIGYDIYGIARDGQVKQLTHLTEHYLERLPNINRSGLSWSPDGRRIAFWLSYAGRPDDWQLAVYDTITNSTTNYCFLSNSRSDLNSIHPLVAPIWSADGKQMIVEYRYDTSSNHVMVVDLDQKIAYPISDNMFPAGWLFP